MNSFSVQICKSWNWAVFRTTKKKYINYSFQIKKRSGQIYLLLILPKLLHKNAEFFESIKVDRKFTVSVNSSENGAGGNFYNLFVSLL
jgi:P2-related tail formation protein